MAALAHDVKERNKKGKKKGGAKVGNMMPVLAEDEVLGGADGGKVVGELQRLCVLS